MTRNVAKAHTNPNRHYSAFHKALLGEKEGDNYALHHIYSLEACRHLMTKWGWSSDEIKTASDNIVIDVMENSVYLHAPNQIIKRGQTIKVRGISRYVAKKEFIDILIERAWKRSDPYKLQPGDRWNEFVAMGNSGEFYSVEMFETEVTCTCHSFRGLEKAFQQDAIAFKILLLHPTTKGQMPDKHVFALWKYLNAETAEQYQHQFKQRLNIYHEQARRDFELFSINNAYDNDEETGF